jgi:uncharacterized protein
MTPVSPSGWCLLVLAAIIIGVSKTGFPGVGILAIPLVAMVIPARASTGLLLPMLVVGDIMAVAFYRRHAVWKYLVKLMPYAIIGILIGYVLLGLVNPQSSPPPNSQPASATSLADSVPPIESPKPQPIIGDKQLKPIIGAVILTLLILNWWRNRRLAKSGEINVPQNWWFPLVMGILAGIITMMANAAGPIIIIYLLAMRLPKHAFIGTGAWYFLILNTFKIPFSYHLHLITPDSLLFNLKLAPIIVAGGFAGFYLVKFVPEKIFTLIAQLLTAAAAVQLIVSVWTQPLK